MRRSQRLASWSALSGGQEAFQGLLPGRQSLLLLVAVQSIEEILGQTKPDTVRVIPLHHLLPDTDRQAEVGLLLPGDRRHLQRLLDLVEDGPAKEQQEGNLAVFQGSEIAGGG